MKQISGFTLIELLIVVAIIGILAAIAVPNFLGAQVRAKVARTESELRSLKNALESFYIDNNQYMPMYANRVVMNRQYRGLDTEDAGACQSDIAHILIGNSRSGRRIYLTTPIAYITSVPYDPFRGDGKEFHYGYGSDSQSYYILTGWGPDAGDGLAGVNDGELKECHYTGARFSERRYAGIRGSNFTLPGLKYDPSNGISSTGDLFTTGP
jgi:prepilin-type N-terminal cleavage/methylation domain-containing protein